MNADDPPTERQHRPLYKEPLEKHLIDAIDSDGQASIQQGAFGISSSHNNQITQKRTTKHNSNHSNKPDNGRNGQFKPKLINEKENVNNVALVRRSGLQRAQLSFKGNI